MPNDRDVAELEAALRSCRLELAAVRAEQEEWAEEHAELEQTRARLAELAAGLDERLTAAERAEGLRGWVKQRMLRSMPTPQERAQLAVLRESGLFDGAWYLRQYPEVARTGLSPALHYLRHGAAEGKEPNPEFSTQRYLAEHPRLSPDKDNPLLDSLSRRR
jgi:hypothetical protein